MKKLYWSDRTDAEAAARRFRGNCRLFTLDPSIDGQRLADRLTGAGMLPLRAEGPEPEKSARDYRELISGLAVKNNTIAWWASTLSEKNEHGSPLYRVLYGFAAIIPLLKDAREPLFAVTDPFMRDQLAEYCRRHDIAFIDCRRILRRGREAAREMIFPGLRLAVFMAELLWRKTLLEFRLGRPIREFLSGCAGKELYIIRSFVDSRVKSYDPRACNPFFGSLPAFAAQRGYTVMTLAATLSDFGGMIRILGTRRIEGIVPEEFFLKSSDLFFAIRAALGAKPNFGGPLLIGDLDVTRLFRDEFDRGRRLLAVSRNLLRYRIAYNLGKRVKFSRYAQTFENYAWEKMMIAGLRDSGNGTSIFGFQHAFISQDSFKYFPGKAESGLMPFPDRIITLGDRTGEILRGRGCYSGRDIRTGCALRQEYLQHSGVFSRPSAKRLMVPLTMAPLESARIIRFIADSGLSGYVVNFRCHPSLPLCSFMRPEEAAEVSGRGFSFDNSLSVRDELALSSAVLYTWSTVAVEAVYQGIPAVFMDILSPLRVDPLFECPAFRRTAGSAAGLRDALDSLHGMSDREYEKERLAAREYLDSYFHPVNPGNIEHFF